MLMPHRTSMNSCCINLKTPRPLPPNPCIECGSHNHQAKKSIQNPTMRYPAIFVNHGGGPLPLLGEQAVLAKHLKEVTNKWLPKEKPKSIVVVSAHWESDPVKITSSDKPAMYFDYYGFPPESYKFNYPAPGNPELATKIHNLLTTQGIKSQLDEKRGYDHGVFVPLMLMYPAADIPVVCVSLHSSLSAKLNMDIGKALAPLRDEDVLIVGSGYTFHNMRAFFNPSDETYKASASFNEWLKSTILQNDNEARLNQLEQWDKAPGARICHPREEHLLPLLVAAATSANATRSTCSTLPDLIFNVDARKGEHAVSGYLFN